MAQKTDLSKFDDHLFVTLSIIVGLALASALESWVQIIRNLAYTELFHLHAGYSFFAFIWAVQFWWGLWKYQNIKWNFQRFLLFLFIAISIFLANELAYPEIVNGEFISLKDYYFSIRPWFFYCAVIYDAFYNNKKYRHRKKTDSWKIQHRFLHWLEFYDNDGFFPEISIFTISVYLSISYFCILPQKAGGNFASNKPLHINLGCLISNQKASPKRRGLLY